MHTIRNFFIDPRTLFIGLPVLILALGALAATATEVAVTVAAAAWVGLGIAAVALVAHRIVAARHPGTGGNGD